MQQIFIDLIGYLAAIIGTSMMLPQLIKSLRTKRVKDLSLFMLFLYFLNCVLWDTYGILIASWPVIAGNSIALMISLLQIYIKVKYDKKR